MSFILKGSCGKLILRGCTSSLLLKDSSPDLGSNFIVSEYLFHRYGETIPFYAGEATWNPIVIQSSSDGGYYVGGEYQNPSMRAASYIESGYLAKFSASGELEWNRVYFDPAFSPLYSGSTPSSGVLPGGVFGIVEDVENDVLYTNADHRFRWVVGSTIVGENGSLVTKIDKTTGNVIDSCHITSTEPGGTYEPYKNSYPRGRICAFDDGVVVPVMKLVSGVKLSTIIGLDSSLNELWQKEFLFGTGYYDPIQLTVSNDDYLIVTGKNTVVKISPGQNGSVAWAKTIDSLTDAVIQTARVDSEGNIICFGFDDDLGSPFIVKLDEIGNIVWAKVAPTLSGHDHSKLHGDIDEDGNIYAVTNFYNVAPEDYYLDIWKLDQDGNVVYTKRIGRTYWEFDDNTNYAYWAYPDNMAWGSEDISRVGNNNLYLTARTELYQYFDTEDYQLGYQYPMANKIISLDSFPEDGVYEVLDTQSTGPATASRGNWIIESLVNEEFDDITLTTTTVDFTEYRVPGDPEPSSVNGYAYNVRPADSQLQGAPYTYDLDDIITSD